MSQNTNKLPNDLSSTPDINPATGLPLIKDAWTDIAGSPYGQDIHQSTWTPSASSYESWQPSWDSLDL